MIPEKEFLIKLAHAKMPFGKYEGRYLIDLPEYYLVWYNNVYEKGALIAMCMDIIIREKSNGERGILDLMRKLSNEYGSAKPFDDAELFPKIISLTYPEVGDFINTYVVGTTPIPYDQFFAKMGIGKMKRQEPANPFLKGQTPYITIKPGTKDIVVLNGTKLSPFFYELKMEGGDVITAINGTAYSLDNIYNMIMDSQNWKNGDEITVDIKRDDKPMTMKGKVKLDMKEVEGFGVTDATKDKFREAWLKK